MHLKKLHSLLSVSALLLAQTALAGSISGTVQNASNQPLQNIQVRVWTQGPKGDTPGPSALTDATGVYAIGNLPAGTYKLHARMGPGVSGNYGDRWYDVAAPVSNGYVGGDADEVVVGEFDALTGFNFTLEVLGGFDGQVTANGGLFQNALVRGERAGQPAIHHNDLTQTGPHAGRFYLRGMVPASDYRFIVHDAQGQFETLQSEGPHTATSGTNAVLPPFALTAAPADPAEPNNDAATSVDVDEGLFAQLPPVPYTSTGGRIAPRSSGDVDWFCWDANANERFIIEARSQVMWSAGAGHNPFVDPVVGFFTGDGLTRLGEDDDSGPGLSALLDTGLLTAAGRYCAAVTTFGDTAFNGTGQGSAGAFTLTINMGNRMPVLDGTQPGGAPLPVPPLFIELDEGDTVSLDFTWSDPDGDVLNVTGLLTDNTDTPVGAFVPGAGGGNFTWTANQAAANGSPYQLAVVVQDAEFTVGRNVVIVVNQVNQPPSTPVHTAPADGSVVDTATPSLVVQNATDGDGDVLQYEFALYYGDAQNPAQTQRVPEGAGGSTTFTPAAVPENTVVRWRVRAFDGQVDSPYSPWTTEWTFFVDVQNEAPGAPVLLKPDEAEVVMTKLPALSSSHPVDPEGDPVTLHFQLAEDAQFTQGLIESPPVPVPDMGTSTAWTVTGELPWGSAWFARVYARDDRGGQSDDSDVHRFEVKPNAPPSVPALGAPFDVTCQGLEVTSSVATVLVGPSTDPENEGVRLQLRVLPFDGDPNTTPPLHEAQQDQPGTLAVSFNLSGVAFEEDGRYRFRARAFDGIDYSEWAECDLAWNQVPNENGDGNGDGNGNGAGPEVKPGCGCNTGGPSVAVFALLLAAAFFSLRRAGL